MNIVLGKDNASKIGEKYVILELDTLKISKDSDPVTAYCLVETTNLNELAILDTLRDHHSRMMDAYKTKNWHQVKSDIEGLKGCWGGQVDSFYEEIETRVNRYINDDPGEDWSPVLDKVAS